jgi:hypothetical protein
MVKDPASPAKRTCTQFHQHFTPKIFVRKCFLCSFTNLQFGFVIFWQKYISAKAACKLSLSISPTFTHIAL